MSPKQTKRKVRSHDLRKAVAMWRKRFDTYDISKRLDVNEAAVYNSVFGCKIIPVTKTQESESIDATSRTG